MTVLQWWRQGGGGAMTKRLLVNPAPGPLEHYAQRFDDLFSRARAQREGFRRYLEGLLLPAERNKTLTALANSEPLAGAQRKEAQSLQWSLSVRSGRRILHQEFKAALRTERAFW